MDGSSSQSSTPMVSVLGKRKQTQPSGTFQLGTPSPQDYLHSDYYEDYWDDDPDVEEDIALEQIEEEEEGEEGEEEVEEVEKSRRSSETMGWSSSEKRQ
ncbi:hypothetical protein ACFX15_013127 [Malus domestica]